MGQVLVRNLEDDVIARLKIKARSDGSSLEELARKVLREAAKPSQAELWAEADCLRTKIGKVTGDSTGFIREDRDNNEPFR